MNLKILFMIILYYSVFSIVFLLGGDVFASSEGYSSNFSLNQTGDLTASEVDTGGLFGQGVSFGRFFGLITIGIGLPADTFPAWFIMLFMTWQTLITILTVGFIISSIWDG